MLRIVYLAMVMLLVGCSRYDAATDSGGHHCFAMGKAVLHAQRSLLELLLDESQTLQGDFVVGPVELMGEGTLHIGVADYRPINRHIRPVRFVNEHNMYSPLFIEAENLPDDSTTVLISFSYTHSNDTIFEIVSGTLNIPLVRDSFSLHHRVMHGGELFYESVPDDGTSQKLMLDIDYLLM